MAAIASAGFLPIADPAPFVRALATYQRLAPRLEVPAGPLQRALTFTATTAPVAPAATRQPVSP